MIFQASIFGLSLCADVICRSAWSIWYQCCLYSVDMPGQSETSRMLFSYFWTNSHTAVTARILESEAWLFVGVLFHLGGSLSRSSFDPSPRWGRPLHVNIFSYCTCLFQHSIHFASTSSAGLSGYLIHLDAVKSLKTFDPWPLTLFIAQHFSVQSDNVLSFIPFAKSSWYLWWSVARILFWVLISLLLHQTLQYDGFLPLAVPFSSCVVVVVVVLIAVIMVMLVLSLRLLLRIAVACLLLLILLLLAGCWLFVVSLHLLFLACCWLLSLDASWFLAVKCWLLSFLINFFVSISFVFFCFSTGCCCR